MFNTVTWQGYWIAIALLSAGYYIVIYLLYFRHDFKVSLRKGENRKWALSEEKGSLQPTLFESNTPTDFDNKTATEVDQLVNACTDELSAYFGEAGRSKGAKEEMLFALSKLLSKYPALRFSEYQALLNNIIQSEAQHHCGIHLSREDISKAWLG
ncbi:MAG: hypothetical protein EOO10_25050 [Chitinophagaceae bacterium]|nr:MAG: hypothetical protein EOO10_25050 [Chitinophagaceae bacterium]